MKLLLRMGEIGIGLMFIVSSLIHIAGPYFYLESAIRYQIASGDFLSLAIPFLTALQLVAGTSLLLGLFRRPALAWSGILFLGFCVAQLTVLWRGIEVSCGCYGTSSSQVSIESVMQLLLMFLLATTLFWFARTNEESSTNEDSSLAEA